VWQFLRDILLPLLLFVCVLLLALALGMLVLAAPWLAAGGADNRFMQLFAQDSTVRRTAAASSLGLVVTAFVFFRPSVLRKKKPRRPPPSILAGA
jgi:hypothetical protein